MGHQPYGNEHDFAKLQTWLPAGKNFSAGGRRPFVIGIVASFDGFRRVFAQSKAWVVQGPCSFAASSHIASERRSLSLSLASLRAACFRLATRRLSLSSPSKTRLKVSCSRKPSTVVPFPAVMQPFASCISGFMGPPIRVLAADIYQLFLEPEWA